MVFFRSGHPRALSPTQTRRTTMTPHRRRSLFILSDIIADPILSPGSNHSPSPLSTPPPSFRLPLPYSYNPTHSIPSCYYLLDLVSSTQPLMCIISTHAARQCKHVSPPQLCSLLFCVSCTSSIGLPCSAFSISILLMTAMAMTKVLLLLLLRRSFFFSYLFTLCYFIVFHPFSPYPRFPFYSWDAGRFFIFYFWRLACAITFFSFFFSTTTNLHHHHQQQVYQVSNPVVLPPGVFY